MSQSAVSTNPDVAQQVLAPLSVDNSVKADAWEAYNNSSSLDDFTNKMKSIDLPQDAKAQLWESANTRFNSKAQGKPGFFTRLGQSLGIPTSMDEVRAMNEQSKKEMELTPTNLLENALGGPAFKAIKGYGQRVIQAGKEAGKEAYEAGTAAGEGAPMGPQIGKVGHAMAHFALQATPLVGPTLETIGEDLGATKDYGVPGVNTEYIDPNYAGAAGGATGIIAQVAAPEMAEKGLGKINASIARGAEATKPLRQSASLGEIPVTDLPVGHELGNIPVPDTAEPAPSPMGRVGETPAQTAAMDRLRQANLDHLEQMEKAQRGQAEQAKLASKKIGKVEAPPITPADVKSAPGTSMGPKTTKVIVNGKPTEITIQPTEVAPKAAEPAPKAAEATPKAAEATSETHVEDGRVKQHVFDLTNVNLKKMGQAVGLDPEDYNFSRREAPEGRSQKIPVERHQMVDDIMGKLSPEQIQQLDEQSRRLGVEPTVGGEPERNFKSRAEESEFLLKHFWEGKPAEVAPKPAEVAPKVDATGGDKQFAGKVSKARAMKANAAKVQAAKAEGASMGKGMSEVKDNILDALSKAPKTATGAPSVVGVKALGQFVGASDAEVQQALSELRDEGKIHPHTARGGSQAEESFSAAALKVKPAGNVLGAETDVDKLNARNQQFKQAKQAVRNASAEAKAPKEITTPKETMGKAIEAQPGKAQVDVKDTTATIKVSKADNIDDAVRQIEEGVQKAQNQGATRVMSEEDPDWFAAWTKWADKNGLKDVSPTDSRAYDLPKKAKQKGLGKV